MTRARSRALFTTICATDLARFSATYRQNSSTSGQGSFGRRPAGIRDMKLIFAFLMLGGVAVYISMGQTQQTLETRETSRAGAKVVHVAPQSGVEVPTFEANMTCKAVLSVIDVLQRRPRRDESDVARLQANLRAEAEKRADVRQHDPSYRAQQRLSASLQQNYPDGTNHNCARMAAARRGGARPHFAAEQR